MRTRQRHRVVLSIAAVLAAGSVPAPVPAEEPLSTFFVGRVRFAENDGRDCGDVGLGLARLVSRASSITVRGEEPVALLDEDLFETPFLFMNGHNDFVLTDEELANLSEYLARGGFLLGSGCCTNPAFPAAWRREMGRLFPGEAVRSLPYDHMIYRSFYQLDRVRSLNGDRDIFLEGLFHEGNLVAVLGEDGLCCAFAMNGVCNEGNGVVPEDAQKVALNIAVYSLTH